MTAKRLESNWRVYRNQKLQKPSGQEEEKPSCSRTNLIGVGWWPYPAWVASKHSSVVQSLTQVSKTWGRASTWPSLGHTPEIRFGKWARREKILDSTVGCRHLVLPTNKRIYHEWEVISPSRNPGTPQKLQWKMGSHKMISAHKEHEQWI